MREKMDTTQEFKINKGKDGYELTTSNVRTMSLKECIKEQEKLQADLLTLDKQIEAMEKAIADKKLEKDLANLKSQKDNLIELSQDWDLVVQDEMDELDKKLRRKVHKSKIDKGYKRIDDTNVRIIKQNEILAPILSELDLDPSNKIVKQVKIDFDKI